MSTTAEKRYNRTVLLLMASYALILFGVTVWFRHGTHDGPLAIVAAALPAVPIVGVFALMGRYLSEERDEYLRMLHVRQALVATGFALAIATVWGFLESFGQVPRVDSYWVAILWFFRLGVGAWWNRAAGDRP